MHRFSCPKFLALEMKTLEANLCIYHKCGNKEPRKKICIHVCITGCGLPGIGVTHSFQFEVGYFVI